jgi:hypothetical protein
MGSKGRKVIAVCASWEDVENLNLMLNRLIEATEGRGILPVCVAFDRSGVENRGEESLLEFMHAFELPNLAGFMLLASLLLWRDLPSLRHSSILVPLLTLSPLIFGLPGLINTTEWGYAANWYWHFYSAAAICTGIWWTSRHDNRLLPWLLNTIAVSTALTIAAGWQQRFGGQEAELRMQLEHAAETGRELPRQMIERMQQTRVSGNFSDPNVYAAHLLLTVPLLLAVL